MHTSVSNRASQTQYMTMPGTYLAHVTTSSIQHHLVMSQGVEEEAVAVLTQRPQLLRGAVVARQHLGVGRAPCTPSCSTALAVRQRAARATKRVQLVVQVAE